MDELPICHDCANIMKRDIRPSTIIYKGHSVVVDQPGWYCTGCEEALLGPEDMDVTEPVFLELKRQVEKDLKIV